MVDFPLLQSLSVDGYAMFPGNPLGTGLDVKFPPGLSLIVGANGLGKSTIVSILYRMFAGPFDIPGLAGRDRLGNLELESDRIEVSRRKIFAQRVGDGAKESRATLTVLFGKKRVTLVRSLKDLSLLSLRVGSELISGDLELAYQKLIPPLVGVWSFGDWLLMLNTLVFYFETRRQLVWDKTAQVQVLRLLFLSAADSKRLASLSRSILELDSDVRNTLAVLNRRLKELDDRNRQKIDAPGVREELESLENYEREDTSALKNLASHLFELESARESTRRHLLKLEQDRDGSYRDLEQAKLQAIGNAFPTASENAKYIFAQLLTSGRCLACGTVVPKVATQYSKRIKDHHCVVCDTNLRQRARPVPISAKQISKTEIHLQALDDAILAIRESLAHISADIERQEQSHRDLRLRQLERSTRIAQLESQLPPDASAERHRFNVVHAMQSDLESRRFELERLRENYRKVLLPMNKQLMLHSERIKTEFERFARDFLLEDITLDWSPYRSPLGQTGQAFDFPAFGLDMGSGTLPSPVRRDTPDQVSESQREFIDLAFRMALITVAGNQASGTLVVDAPESSLDTVFVRRAAQVLGRFARSGANRLVITSNLVDGDLIPNLLTFGTHGSTGANIVDLFEIAAPTAATHALASEYRNARRRLLKNSPKNNSGRSRRA